jgi:hypothetical protein
MDRFEKTFEVGDLVFLRLQPYIQSSLKKRISKNIKPCFYGPYRVVWRVGEVAYELELSEGRKIQMHFKFHVSKRNWGNKSPLRWSYLH